MKRLLGIILLIGLLLTGLSSCSKEEPIPGDQVLALSFFVTTDNVISFNCRSAFSGGRLIANVDGNGVITAQGVCWNTMGNPTTADNKTIAKFSFDPNHFYSTITGLNPGTPYYVRAFAKNSAGIVYGNEVSFTTPECTDPPCDSVSDIDGNIYKTIQIGTQTWITENLKTTRYNDGNPILFGKGAPAGYTDWFDCGDGNYRYNNGAYCWYDNDPSTYKDAFGAIYNWYAVGTGKLCPTGWHVPTISDWTTLITSLGGVVKSFNEKTENAEIFCAGVDESGFTHVNHGELCGWGFLSSDFWWSATPRPVELRVPYAYLMSFYIYAYEPQSYGYSVRCLKD
jgi:uncharacterized protein (TIGR02145 family)